MPASEKRLTSETVGEVESDDGVLILRRIHVTYSLRTSAEHEEKARRAHEIHMRYCPVYRSIEAAIEVSTELQLEIE